MAARYAAGVVLASVTLSIKSVVLIVVDSARGSSVSTISRQSFDSVATSKSDVDNPCGWVSGPSTRNDFALERMSQEARIDAVWFAGQDQAERKSHQCARTDILLQQISEKFGRRQQ